MVFLMDWTTNRCGRGPSIARPAKRPRWTAWRAVWQSATAPTGRNGRSTATATPKPTARAATRANSTTWFRRWGPATSSARTWSRCAAIDAAWTGPTARRTAPAKPTAPPPSFILARTVASGLSVARPLEQHNENPFERGGFSSFFFSNQRIVKMFHSQ